MVPLRNNLIILDRPQKLCVCHFLHLRQNVIHVRSRVDPNVAGETSVDQNESREYIAEVRSNTGWWL
jgi:hypothetical protein